MGELRVGTCSWTDRSLLRSGFYPTGVKTAAARLAFYAKNFDIVEVDSSFYALPDPSYAVRWLACTDENFRFGIKSFATFTFHRTTVNALPKWLRDELGPSWNCSVRREDLSSDQRLRLYEEFLLTVSLLHKSGRLAYLLFQFPPRAGFSRETLGYLRRLRKVSGPLPLAVEVRNSSWFQGKNRAAFLDVLRGENMAYVAVDAPSLPHLPPPDWPITAEWGGLVRFHGRNKEAWLKPNATVEERFDYDYSEAELREWESAVRERSAKSRRLYLLYNNCVSDKAVRSARLMKRILGLKEPRGYDVQTTLNYDI